MSVVSIRIKGGGMKRAIAYLRFSSLQQVQGDSVRRQKKLIDEWLKHNADYYLDPVTFEDLGLSAYRGQHAISGAFSEFMEAVQKELIEAGSVLLVESLDRLSREKIGDASDRLRTILKAGIDVVTLTDGTHYTRDSLDDPYSIIKAILIAQRANEESEIKSKLQRAVWAEKRKQAAEKGEIMTRHCPSWLKVNAAGNGFEVIEDKADIIRTIFEMRLDGRSFEKISQALNVQGKKNLRGKVSQWNSASIERLVKSKAVIGVLSPSYRITVPDVEDISNYYPAIISIEDFERVRRISYEPESRRNTNFNPHLINIFKGLMHCKECGHAIILTGINTKGYGYYVCSMRRQHRCKTEAVRRDLTDRYLITGVIKGASGMDLHLSGETALTSMTARQLELTGKLQNVIKAIELAPDVRELTVRAAEISTEIIKLKSDMAEIQDERDMKAASALNVLNVADRKEFQLIARRIILDIKIDGKSKTCDIYLHNGMKVLNYPLTKSTGWSSILDAMAYLEQTEIIL